MTNLLQAEHLTHSDNLQLCVRMGLSYKHHETHF